MSPVSATCYTRKDDKRQVEGDMSKAICSQSVVGFTVSFDVKRRSVSLLPFLVKPEVVSNGQTVADRSIHCIKVE